VSVQGLSKTAALTTLVLPLLVLAVPLIDTSFVVARRIKYGQPVYVADRAHLHYRFENIGFSQRRSVVYLYAWCLTLTLAALATRFIHPHPHGHWNPTNLAIDAAIGALAIGASLYVVYLLEIVKLANPFIRRREEAGRAEQPRKSA
jgi:UDP-GlcNAc:undecaprenyl-phosphate/decaprenyl-phosphate GlcNAc-1-phosphate transferase